MSKSSAVVLIGSLATLGCVVGLGLNVPTEELQRAPAINVDEGIKESAAMLGPAAIRLLGPDAPSVPALPLRSAATSLEDSEAATAPEPIRIQIPAIDIDAVIVPAGVDPAGQVEVPRAEQVGWYVHGPEPGGSGSSVLAAHVNLGQQRGAFYSLEHVVPGDRIQVEMSDGQSISFEVIDDTLYDKTALPDQDLFRRDGESVLRLITCGGSYDPATNHYLGNRVVTARPLKT